jgi:hypothetical protein
MHCERLGTLISYWQHSVRHIIELIATHVRILHIIPGHNPKLCLRYGLHFKMLVVKQPKQ